MQASPLLPIAGLIVIVFNVVIAALRPYMPPKVMGIELFLGGMLTLTIAVVDLLNPLGIGVFERTLLFVAGCINCSLGYYMVLLEIQKQGG